MSDEKQQIRAEIKNPMVDIIDKLHAVIAEKQAFETHAVEVLAKELDRLEQGRKYISWEEEVSEVTKNRIRAEAKELLGCGDES